MKVLYTNFHSSDGGGHTTYIASLLNSLGDQCELYLAVPPSSRLFKTASMIKGVTAIPFEFSGLRPSQVRELAHLIKQHRFDIIHVNGASDHRLAILATMGMKRPAIVYTKHNSKPCRSIGNFLRAHLGTDRVIAVSRHTKALLLKSPYHCRPIDMIHNGIDTAFFSPLTVEQAAQARRQWLDPAEGGDLILGSNAGTASYKGWMDLVETLASLSEQVRDSIRVIIAGKMPGETILARIQALGVARHIRFTGPLEDVRPMIAAIDVGFVLSHDVETISFACREMMAMAKPVIVSDYAGLPENIIDGHNGWIVRSRNQEDLAGILQRLLNDKALVQRAGQAARDHASQHFGLEQFSRLTRKTYKDALTPIA